MDNAAVDGNAIGGLLAEVFGTEMTTAVGTCGSCGAVSLVAELAVYRPGLLMKSRRRQRWRFFVSFGRHSSTN